MTVCVLITNLSGVNVGDVRIWARALLLEDCGPSDRTRTFDGPRYRLRGFGAEAGDVMFTMTLPSIEYLFARDQIADDVAGRLGGNVLSTHGHLRIVNSHCAYAPNEVVDHQDDPYTECSCHVLALDCDSQDGQPISFERFECGADADERMYRALWSRLHASVCHFNRRPFIPVRSMVSEDLARKATNEDRRAGNPWLVLPRSAS